MYLEPVFSSPDITKSLPTEGEEFKKVDHDWRHNVIDKIKKD